jgi:hypothetical protein
MGMTFVSSLIPSKVVFMDNKIPNVREKPILHIICCADPGTRKQVVRNQWLQATHTLETQIGQQNQNQQTFVIQIMTEQQVNDVLARECNKQIIWSTDEMKQWWHTLSNRKNTMSGSCRSLLMQLYSGYDLKLQTSTQERVYVTNILFLSICQTSSLDVFHSFSTVGVMFFFF